jgi:formamidase
MITPSLHGGHQVTQPIFVKGAEVGGGIVIRIRDITVASITTASGHDGTPEGVCLGDP